ncbi:hypothetical protein SDC9_129561 [bioreactor metagenome]|uniref:Uncharacterized protein n=1 Tax=bioreactor metagenome TaxID=1076179 RepID=A0A645CZ64_9ZZZZ
MAQTLDWIRSCDYVLHIVDITTLAHESVTNSPNIDIEIYNYGRIRHNYAMLANKIDLPSAKTNLSKVTATFPNTLVIPISGLHGTGFKEVKTCVARNI